MEKIEVKGWTFWRERDFHYHHGSSTGENVVDILKDGEGRWYAQTIHWHKGGIVELPCMRDDDGQVWYFETPEECASAAVDWRKALKW